MSEGGGGADGDGARLALLEGLLWEWVYGDWSSAPELHDDLEARTREALPALAAEPPLYMRRPGSELCRCLQPVLCEPASDRILPDGFRQEWSARRGCVRCRGTGRTECEACAAARGARPETVPADYRCARCGWRPTRTGAGP